MRAPLHCLKPCRNGLCWRRSRFCNGADFDQPILICGYRAAGVKQGWTAYNGRCYRTIKNLFPEPKLVRQGDHHHALDDAKSQATHLIELVKAHGLVLR